MAVQRTPEPVRQLDADALGIGAGPFPRQTVATAIGGVERNRHELAVGGGVELDGKALSFRVGRRHDTISRQGRAHHDPPRAGRH